MACETKQFIDYINCHITEIVNHINEQFHNSKDFIKAKILHEIKGYLEPLPIHYEWQYDGCPYDCSGELVYDGYVSLNQTISDFLANEYSGQKVPTYESGRGFNYLTYGDKLSDFTRSLADTIMYNSVKSQLENVFDIVIDAELFSEIMDDYYNINYIECLADDFFTYEIPIDFVDIGQMKLIQLTKGKKKKTPNFFHILYHDSTSGD